MLRPISHNGAAGSVFHTFRLYLVEKWKDLFGFWKKTVSKLERLSLSEVIPPPGEGAAGIRRHPRTVPGHRPTPCAVNRLGEGQTPPPKTPGYALPHRPRRRVPRLGRRLFAAGRCRRRVSPARLRLGAVSVCVFCPSACRLLGVSPAPSGGGCCCGCCSPGGGITRPRRGAARPLDTKETTPTHWRGLPEIFQSREGISGDLHREFCA